jgi:large subunit ribosomal protein L18
VRPVRKAKTSEEKRRRRHFRVRRQVAGTPERPRLVVFRSLKHIYAHLVDDTSGGGGRVLMGVADRSEGVAPEGNGKVARGFAVGVALAAKAREAGITRVVFDRAGYAYHGRVKAVADGARKGGLEF